MSNTSILDTLKNQIVNLLNDEMSTDAAKAYQNCINMIDDLLNEQETTANTESK